MKWVLVGLALVIFPFSALAAEVLKIGAIFPLSGGGAFYGEDSKRAIGLAMDTLGGKVTVGGKNYEVQMVYYDDGGVPSEAVKGLRKLVTVDGVHVIIGPVGASSVNAVLTVNEQEKVLVLGNSGDGKSTRMGNKFYIRLQTVPSMIGGRLRKISPRKGNQVNLCSL